MTSALQNIRLELAQGAAATRVQRAMRAFLLRKGTIIIMILVTKIQAAVRGLNTRTSLNKFLKACPPSGRTADLSVFYASLSCRNLGSSSCMY